MTIYGDHALTYFNNGCIPLPMWPDKKKPRVSGYHGYKGNTPTRSILISWLGQFIDCNLALRLPPHIVGIDVDAYGDKKGAQSLAELEKKLGPLPATLISTSRDDGISGIRLFKLPNAYVGMRIIGVLADGIEIIHWGNRYVMAPPSLHPTGRAYRWEHPTGDGPPRPLAGAESAADGLFWTPRWDDLATLPETYCEAIRAHTHVPENTAAEYPTRFDLSNQKGTSGGLRILRKEIETDWPDIRDTKGWNNSLFACTARIAELVAGGELEFDTTRQALITMALTADPDMDGVEATVDSGFKKGMANPRVLKEFVRIANTDKGNAELFISIHGENIRYCYPWKNWYVWDKRHWLKVQNGEIARRASDVSRFLLEKASKENDSDRRKTLTAHALSMEFNKRIGPMLETTKSDITIDTAIEQFNSNSELFTTQNGITFNCQTFETYPAIQKDLITYLIGADYDPEIDCPTWHKFLIRALPDQDVRDFVRRAVGYSLTGSTQEKALFVIYGPPDCGKSKFVEALLALFGDYGHALKDDTIVDIKAIEGNNDDVADLVSKRFALLDELPDGCKLNLALVKKLTGSNTYTAQRKYERSFSFMPEFKIWIDTNFRPHIDGDDDAMWGRVKLIPFNVVIPEGERDPNLADKFKAELPGILNWAIQGLRDWRRVGLQAPVKIKEATEEYRASEDTLSDFLEERCLMGSDRKVAAHSLVAAYNRWSDSKLSAKAFKPKMEAKGFISKRFSSGYYWTGLSLVSDSEHLDGM